MYFPDLDGKLGCHLISINLLDLAAPVQFALKNLHLLHEKIKSKNKNKKVSLIYYYIYLFECTLKDTLTAQNSDVLSYLTTYTHKQDDEHPHLFI